MAGTWMTDGVGKDFSHHRNMKSSFFSVGRSGATAELSDL